MFEEVLYPIKMAAIDSLAEKGRQIQNCYQRGYHSKREDEVRGDLQDYIYYYKRASF
jgi:hypothetical protein